MTMPNKPRDKAQHQDAREFHTGFLSEGRDGHRIVLPPDPRLAAPWDKADWGAWKAFDMGRMSESQQIRAMEHLALITNFNGETFVPDPYQAAYAQGKRRVFGEIYNIIRTVFPSGGTGLGDGGEQG